MALDLRPRHSALLLLAALLHPSAAIIVDFWALDNFSMDCPSDGHSCDYTFDITEGLDDPTTHIDGKNRTTCAFTVDSLGAPATLTNFTDCACEGTDAYRVNGGWDPLGFVTLCVSRADEDAWAFFGYDSWQVVNANASWRNTRPAYRMFTFNETDEPRLEDEDALEIRMEETRPSQVLDERTGPVAGNVVGRRAGGRRRALEHNFLWTIDDLRHEIFPDQTTKLITVLVSFQLLVTEIREEGNYTRYEAACSMLEEVDPSRKNVTAAWFEGEPCFESEDGYYFSWYPWYTGPNAWLTITNPRKALRLLMPAELTPDGPVIHNGPWQPEYLGRTP